MSSRTNFQVLVLVLVLGHQVLVLVLKISRGVYCAEPLREISEWKKEEKADKPVGPMAVIYSPVIREGIILICLPYCLCTSSLHCLMADTRITGVDPMHGDEQKM